MLSILSLDDLAPTPWKNGGGITREVARADGDKGWLWRLSVAEVTSDGPFSYFPGMTRILTVIEGAGINLVTPDGILTAGPGAPVHFSGDTPVEGRLRDGPIRDLNVIYDGRRVTADVTPVPGPATLPAGPGMTWALCLAGPLQADGTGVPVGSLAHGTTGTILIGAGGVALVVRIGATPTP